MACDDDCRDEYGKEYQVILSLMHMEVFNCILMHKMGLSAQQLEYLETCIPNC
jgi:hypothetical protein